MSYYRNEEFIVVQDDRRNVCCRHPQGEECCGNPDTEGDRVDIALCINADIAQRIALCLQACADKTNDQLREIIRL